jgi:hypothetical protein
MSWLITGTQKTDPDALAYLAEVERADGQALESGVRNAVIVFVTGCKADGIWSAIKASCILAGARTLAGALVPLVGVAPINVGFSSASYNRKLGLTGSGTSSTYLDTNRNNNADPQNSNHNSVFITAIAASPTFGTLAANLQGNNVIGGTVVRSRSQTSDSYTPVGLGLSTFTGISRASSTAFTLRTAGTTSVVTRNSEIPQNSALITHGATGVYSSSSIAFYSIGESLDLALLDARVTTLINAFDAAI